MNIQIFKLVTNEFIIAEVKNHYEGTKVLDKAFVIMVAQEGIALMPFNIFGKQKPIEIKDEHILFEAEPDPEIYNAYKSQTGGIVTPNPGLDLL